jgi:tetratricopeptide (TPR) repeat protein
MADARAIYKEAFQHYTRAEFADAIDAYRRCLELDAGLANAWSGLAMALARSDDLDGAIEAARKAIELEPDEPLGHTSLSMFYQQKGMIPEAEDEKALATRLTMQRQGR